MSALAESDDFVELTRLRQQLKPLKKDLICDLLRELVSIRQGGGAWTITNLSRLTRERLLKLVIERSFHHDDAWESLLGKYLKQSEEEKRRRDLARKKEKEEEAERKAELEVLLQAKREASHRFESGESVGFDAYVNDSNRCGVNTILLADDLSIEDKASRFGMFLTYVSGKDRHIHHLTGSFYKEVKEFVHFNNKRVEADGERDLMLSYSSLVCNDQNSSKEQKFEVEKRRAEALGMAGYWAEKRDASYKFLRGKHVIGDDGTRGAWFWHNKIALVSKDKLFVNQVRDGRDQSLEVVSVLASEFTSGVEKVINTWQGMA